MFSLARQNQSKVSSPRMYVQEGAAMSQYVANREHRGVEGNWHQCHRREHRYQPRYRSSGGSIYGSRSNFVSHTTSRSSNPLRYKTELCRTFEESGNCRFGESCTFAHGIIERRAVPRHPRYKTELCRTYHSTGFCQYGTRCHFIHSPGEQSRGLPLKNLRHRSHFDHISKGIVQFPMQAGSVQSIDGLHFMTSSLSSLNYPYDFKALQVGAKPTLLDHRAMQASNSERCVFSWVCPSHDIGIDSIEGSGSGSSRSESPKSMGVFPPPSMSPTLEGSPSWDNTEDDIGDIQGIRVSSFDESVLRKSLDIRMLSTRPSISNPMEISRGLNLMSVLVSN
ncbi:uncharacterized protein LOC143021009 [Oratosquilla oratoria]|uniref:uncharacterized protein LOC143021009 n=1 Tax=Oratosquilla oratoria TaxID=337810 RepID=UPI003F759A09